MSQRALEPGIDLGWDLADRLRKALRVSGIGVQEMAEELELDRNTVGRYINGHTAPARPTLIVWAMRTGVPVEWLVNGDEPQGRESKNPRPSDSDGGDSLVRHQGLEPRTRWLTALPALPLERETLRLFGPILEPRPVDDDTPAADVVSLTEWRTRSRVLALPGLKGA
jgi:transcriptional regulator with XRE-family HTH domain